MFTGSVTVGTSSGLRTVRIFGMASLPIRRHLLIRAAANPLDPAWNAYYQTASPISQDLHSLCRTPSRHTGGCGGLSRMQGNLLVRF